jgi:PBSX family phage terminase large subunit
VPLLGVVPGGKLLEPPIQLQTRCDKTYAELYEQLVAKLLPAQRDFVDETRVKIVGYCAGFGAGKTHALCAKAVVMAMGNPGTVGAVFEPTHIMIRDVWMRSFDDFLEEHQIQHDFRVSPQPEYTLYLPDGPCTILCRATETWNRIRGQNLSFALIDEIDTSPAEVAQKASEMVLARLRGGSSPQLAVASTPEGYRWMYRTFVESPSDDRRLIKAKTTDNPHLPPGFIDSLYANFPPQLIRSYIEGEFTNLANTSVYPDYDRDRHWTDAVVLEEDRIFCGVDLNVGNCLIEVLVRRGETYHFVEEHVVRDTPAIVAKLRESYPAQLDRGDIVVIPDAASRQRTTTNAKESDLSILRRGGFVLKEQSSNPAIEDRVNAMNVLLMNDRLFVGPRCKHLQKSLEQQAYGKDGKPEKGGTGMDDPSHPVDAAGYAITYLAPLKRWMTGGSRFRTY